MTIACPRYVWHMPLFVWLLNAGCHWGHPAQRQLQTAGGQVRAHVSLVRWNCCSEYESAINNAPRRCQGVRNECCAKAMELASRSHLDLESLMARQPAPTLEVVQGVWLEVRKGSLPALSGQVHAARVFSLDGTRWSGHCVPIKAFDAERSDDSSLCRMANCASQETPKRSFSVESSLSACQPLRLDFTEQHDDWLHPSKYRVDHVVWIDNNLLLGRSYTQLGQSLMPGSYFVLYRPLTNSIVDWSSER